MKLYLLSTTSNDRPYAFSRAVVAAEDEDTARKTHPDGESLVTEEPDYLGTWVPLSRVQAEYLGEGKPGLVAGVIMSSYITG